MRRLFAFVAVFVALLAGFPAVAQDATPVASPHAACPATTEAENEAIVRRYQEEVLSLGNLNLLDDIWALDLAHDDATGGDIVTLEEGKRRIALLRNAFPDLAVTIDEVLTEGDLVAVRYTRSGTHQGEYLGIPATGTEASWTGINVYRIECGRIAESWNETDNLDLLRQLGAMPAAQDPATTAATPQAVAESPAAASCPATTEDENEAIARQWEEEVLGQGNLDLAEDLLAEEFAHDGAVGAETVSREERIQRVVEFRAAFDLSVTVEEVLTEDDLVLVRYTNTATHQGEYAGIEPTGREVTWTGLIVFRIECGRIVETWSESDRLSLLQQLEAETGPATPAATPTS